jgi:exonuclease SbcD
MVCRLCCGFSIRIGSTGVFFKRHGRRFSSQGGSMRILHLADLHLGKIIHDVQLTDDQSHILDQIVTIARDVRAEVVCISGDLYDRSVPPVSATVAMDDFLTALLADPGIPVILTPGNHDSAERLSFAGRLVRSRGLYIAPAIGQGVSPVVLEDRHGPVTFYPLPYLDPLQLRRSVDDQEMASFDQAFAAVIAALPSAAGRTVCLAHCYTQGGITSESERPLSIGGSSLVDPSHFRSFHLTLLGHLHRPQKISDTVFYAGSPLKYSFSESDHRKEVALYDLAADGSFTREVITLRPLRDLRIIRGELADLLAQADNDPARQDYLWAELTDRGALFDYAAALRAAYPNLLNITRSAWNPDRAGEGGIEIRSKSDQQIIASFFRHVTGSELSQDEEQLVLATLDTLRADQTGGLL